MFTHHAVLIFSDSFANAELPDAYITPSVDVLHIETDRFSIDDARELFVLSSSKPVASEKRTFVLIARELALEAQNALLKLFEEPNATSSFIVVLPKTAYVIPTLRSRMLVVTTTSGDLSSDVFATFCSLNKGERMSMIAERTKQKDQAWIEEILQGAEKKASEDTELLSSIVFARTYSGQKGASLKMLLEDIALHL